MATSTSCFDKMLRCFRLRGNGQLQAQYQAVQKEDGGAASAGSSGNDIRWDVAIDRGLGRPCVICGDETRVATHAAPCCHSACELCWASWAADRCMICNCDIEGGLQRAPFNIVPRTIRELTHEPTDALETSFNKALAEFVSLKHQLGAIKRALETAIEHLGEGAEQRDRETRIAVMSINGACIAEQLQQLEGLLNGSSGWRSCVEGLRNVHQATVSLSDTHQLRGGSGAGICALPAVSIDRIRTLLTPHGKEACRVWRGQWLATQSLQADIFGSLLPEALAAVAGALDEDSALHAVTLVSALESVSATEAAAMEELIQSIEATSVQLLEQMQAPSGISIETVALLTPKSRHSLDNLLMEERERVFNTEMLADTANLCVR